MVPSDAYFSQLFDLGEGLLTRMREAIARIAFVSEETNLDEHIGGLTDAVLVVCAQRDVELASTIASTVVTMAHSARSEYDTSRILQALLLASAALQNASEWAAWLERQLAEAALRLPAGEASKTSFVHLQELKKVLRLDLGIHIRAEAIASAAN